MCNKQNFHLNQFNLYIINENSIVNWNWDFGDENFSNEVSPIHTFLDYGIFEVSLIITDNYGQDSTPHIEIINLLSGDLNSDLSVDVIDVIILVNLILDNELEYTEEADLNDDGVLTVLDIVILISSILN